MENNQNSSNASTLVQWTEPAEQYKKVLWDDDNYPAKLTKIQDITGKFGAMKRFIFTVVNPELQETAELAYTVSIKVTKESRAGLAIQALGIPAGQAFTWDGLIGKCCRATVKRKTDLVNKKGEKYSASVITDLLKEKSSVAKVL